jgi:hypothetical protein
MREVVNEPVDVLATFEYDRRKVIKVRPQVLKWRGKRYKVDTFGLYHPERRGVRLFHIFSFSCGTTAFRVELDPDTLGWTMAEVYYAD